MTTTTATGQVDLSQSSSFADGPPWEVFAHLRAHDPVHWNASQDGEGFYSITRHADIDAISRDWQTFSSARKGTFIGEEGILPKELAPLLFQMMDPPEHDRQRGLIQKVFTSKAVAGQADDVRRIVTELIDAVIENGQCDLVNDIAVDLPLIVTANMLGVPIADRRRIFHWTTQMADPDVPRDQKVQMMIEVGEYLPEFIRDRRENPRDDLLSKLIQAEIDGDRLCDAEVAVHFMQLMAAGSESTRNSLVGGMLELIRGPAQQDILRRDPSLLGNAADECVRWQSPIMHQARTATRDVEVAGVTVRENQRVVMWLISGNRDERAFEGPDTFDVTRTAKVRHVAFGGAGRHHCLGAQLARLELTIALDEILRRMPDMQLPGPVTRKVNNSFNGIESMPVCFTPGRATRPDRRRSV